MPGSVEKQFSVTRWLVFTGIAALMYRVGGPDTQSGYLLASGMLLLAVFAGFNDPFSATDENALPKGGLAWAAFVAGVVGIGLFLAGAFL